MAISQKRTQAVKITLTPELHERLKLVADRLGQTPATVCSFAVGQFVAQQVSALQAGEAAIARLSESLTEPARELLERMSAEVGK